MPQTGAVMEQHKGKMTDKLLDLGQFSLNKKTRFFFEKNIIYFVMMSVSGAIIVGLEKLSSYFLKVCLSYI